MNIPAFLQHIEAELVGGRLKALINGVHTFVADMVHGNPILTAAGEAALAEARDKAPALVTIAENVPAAVHEFEQIDPALIAAELAGTAAPAGALTAAAALEAVAKPVAEKAAADAVDAALDGIVAVATKKKAAAK